MAPSVATTVPAAAFSATVPPLTVMSIGARLAKSFALIGRGSARLSMSRIGGCVRDRDSVCIRSGRACNQLVGSGWAVAGIPISQPERRGAVAGIIYGSLAGCKAHDIRLIRQAGLWPSVSIGGVFDLDLRTRLRQLGACRGICLANAGAVDLLVFTGGDARMAIVFLGRRP